MEIVSVKFDEEILKKIDSSLKSNHYSTRTEFIRDAVRDKLNEIEKKNAMLHFEKYLGASKNKTDDSHHRKVRDEISKELAKKYNINLD